MRERFLFACIALLLLSFSYDDLNSTPVTAGDQFTVDDMLFTVLNTFDEAIHIEWGERRFILDEEECENSDWIIVCLDTATNLSAVLDFQESLINITLTRTMNTTADVGETLMIEIEVTNNLEGTTTITVEEKTNANILDFGSFDTNMRWRQKLKSKESRKLFYHILINEDKDLSFNVSAFGGGFTEELEEEEIRVTDFVSINEDYEPNPTQGTLYNFTFDTRSTSTTDSNATISISTPQNVFIDDLGTLSNYTGIPRNVVDLNASSTVSDWFMYGVRGDVKGDITITVETEQNIDEISRQFLFPVETQGFQRLVFLHDNDHKDLPVNVSSSIPIQIYNPNNRSVTIGFSASSTLVSITEPITIPARNTTTKEIIVVPPRESTYGIHVNIEYRDLNNEIIEHAAFIEIQATISQQFNDTVETSQATEMQRPDITVLAPGYATLTEEFEFQVIIPDLDQNVFLSISKDGISLFNTTTRGGTFPVTTTGPGLYVAEIKGATIKSDGYAIVREPIEEVPEEEPVIQAEVEPSAPIPWLWIILLVVISIIATPLILYFTPASKERRLRKQEYEISILEPKTPQEAAAQQQLLFEIREKIWYLETKRQKR